jgi:hypothetical protein
MQRYKLKITLLSDATPGRGEGVAGLVDAEVEHDRYGMPYLRGRSLKGLLVEEWANLRYALEQAGVDLERWDDAATFLFGQPGSTLEVGASMHVGHARLPADLRRAVIDAVRHQTYRPPEILDSLTAIRHQTAVDVQGVPETGSLRAMRVILRETLFEAPLRFAEPPSDDARALLAACTSAARRLGLGRNRGRGRVEMRLYTGDGEPLDEDSLEYFAREVRA